MIRLPCDQAQANTGIDNKCDFLLPQNLGRKSQTPSIFYASSFPPSNNLQPKQPRNEEHFCLTRDIAYQKIYNVLKELDFI